MPLFENALDAIRANLEALNRRERVKLISIGTLTDSQLAAINLYRIKQGLPPISGEVVFIWSHIHKRRIMEDGYSVEDVLDQIQSAFHPSSTVITGKMSAIKNPVERPDRYGNQVRDEAVFECSTKHPRAELFSVVPRGDRNKPAKWKSHLLKVALSPLPEGRAARPGNVLLIRQHQSP
jgi:hypothetical protein